MAVVSSSAQFDISYMVKRKSGKKIFYLVKKIWNLVGIIKGFFLLFI